VTRGTTSNPPNRFEQTSYEPLDVDIEYGDERPPIRTTFFRDSSKSLLSKNDSPDIPFTFSVNPYRGCEHGCIYCYARPSHEYFGFSAGLDFESRIMVKLDAARLLDEALSAKSWLPQSVSISGNTDCYQPVERTLKLTRDCLEVFLAHRNPVEIISKNSLIERDSDVLSEMASMNLVTVILSVTTLDVDLVRVMEPRTATPAKRLGAIRTLAHAGVPVGVMVSPIIPGLTDEHIPQVLDAAAAHGARFAGYTMLRLPGPVQGLFEDWCAKTFPDRANKILNRIRELRGGRLDDARYGTRMTGVGPVSEAIRQLFSLHARRVGLDRAPLPTTTSLFRRNPGGQLALF
jgi:DNA repair photolyase